MQEVASTYKIQELTLICTTLYTVSLLLHRSLCIHGQCIHIAGRASQRKFLWARGSVYVWLREGAPLFNGRDGIDQLFRIFPKLACNFKRNTVASMAENLFLGSSCSS